MTPRRPDAAVIQVIAVTHLMGEGVNGDPVRQVIAYYSMDGQFLAEGDPAGDEQAAPLKHRSDTLGPCPACQARVR